MPPTGGFYSRGIMSRAKKETKENVSEITSAQPMLGILQANLQTVYNWIDSDRMQMPQNECRNMLKLLQTANPIKITGKETNEQ